MTSRKKRVDTYFISKTKTEMFAY